jgi:hypothetical protein
MRVTPIAVISGAPLASPPSISVSGTALMRHLG